LPGTNFQFHISILPQLVTAAVMFSSIDPRVDSELPYMHTFRSIKIVGVGASVGVVVLVIY